MEINL